MRKVISNTTPIISLMKINKLFLLKELYQKIIIPSAVFEEIENGKDKPFYQNLKKFDWIQIHKIKNQPSIKYIFDLDKGEAEVLILADEIQADLIIMDEVMGRRYAKQLEFRLTGTIGILLKAKELGLITSLKEHIDELIEKGTWLSPSLVSKALKIAEE
jgi:predicted nucleic acid-binding protein